MTEVLPYHLHQIGISLLKEVLNHPLTALRQTWKTRCNLKEVGNSSLYVTLPICSNTLKGP